MTPSIRSCSTNHFRTSFSLLVLALPEPREAAPVSSTTAARAFVIHAGEDVLHPAPVRLVTGVACAFGEAVEFVGIVVFFLELGLIPHRIRDHAVEDLEAIGLAELGFAQGVADLDLAFHVVDDHVHVRHRPGARLVFLAIEPGRRERLARGQVHFFLQNQLTLDEQTRRAAARIVDIHPGSGSMMRAMTKPTSVGV